MIDLETVPPVPLTDWETELAGLTEVHEKPSDRVIVKVYMPWVKEFNSDFDPLRDLVYAPPVGTIVMVGDKVLCPPSYRHPSPFEGIVIDLDGEKHPYRGPVKRLLSRVE